MQLIKKKVIAEKNSSLLTKNVENLRNIFLKYLISIQL